MNGRLQGFLNFLDLLAGDERHQAEVVGGGCLAADLKHSHPGGKRTEEIGMNAYSTVRNKGLATILVSVLAAIVSHALAPEERVADDHDPRGTAVMVVLPEVVVTATRLEP
jgi:hypothetical protein